VLRLTHYATVSGEKYVCADHQTDLVYELLEKRLWDDPNKVDGDYTKNFILECL